MSFKIEHIFTPSIGVDLVFNINSLNPISRSSIIHDTDFQKKTIIIAQPLTALSSATAYDTLHLATIFHTKQGKIRAGVQCKPIKFEDQYHLANQAISKAVILKYELPVEEINIRSAFRLPISHSHTIKAKLKYNQTDYYTGKDFSIRDISLTGMGLLVPKKKASPLIGLKKADIIHMGMILVKVGEKENKPVGTLALKTTVARVNHNHSNSHTLVGLSIINMNNKNETLLNSFIHKAQIDELNRLRFRGN